MSDTVSAGHASDEGQRIKETRCKKSKNGKHKWDEKGSWPSKWWECKHCKQTAYSK